MSESKPVRIDGDPKGYDVVEIKQESDCSKTCAFGHSAKCRQLPCWQSQRPDGKHIYYVKKGKKK